MNAFAAMPFGRVSVAVVIATVGLFGLRDALAQGAPTVRVIEEPVVVQPPPFATQGQTVVVPRTRIEIDEGKPKTTEPRPRKKTKSAPAAKEPAGAAPAPATAPAREAAKQPPPLPPAREVAPRKDLATAPRAAAKSNILSGDALGRRQKKAADNTDGED